MNPEPDNSELEVRLASLAEAALIATVLHEAFIEYQPLYTPAAFAATTPSVERVEARMSEGPIWVALLDGAIAGTVSAAARGEGLYVRGMAVLPQARGHLIGELLLGAIDAYAMAHGYTRLFLSTTPFLARAIRLYERWGFHRSNEGPHDLFGTPLFTMVKD